MKTKRIITGSLILVFLISGCSTLNYSYLNKRETFHHNSRGAYMEVKTHYFDHDKAKTVRQSFKGELIFCDSANLYLLNNWANFELQKINFDYITKFSARYANAKDVKWTIPVFSLITISHGWWLILTFPVNLILTSAITYSSNHRYELNQNFYKLENLYKFARFPQGMPENIDHKIVN